MKVEGTVNDIQNHFLFLAHPINVMFVAVYQALSLFMLYTLPHWSMPIMQLHLCCHGVIF